MSFYLDVLELGKSRYYFKPNILSANGSIIVTDPKGELLRDCPKFIIVSFTPEAGLVYRYKNVADCVTKYPKINCSELSYKIICAKRTIWKEQQDLIENKILEEKKKNSFWGKLKRLIVE